MDQNADGTSDENPLTTPFTGLTPGDVYAVPTPQPSVPVMFGPNPLSILEPPFNQNTLPLIVPGPQVISTQVVAATGTVGANNLVLNGTTERIQRDVRPAHAGGNLYARPGVADHGANRLDQRSSVFLEQQRQSANLQSDDNGSGNAEPTL